MDTSLLTGAKLKLHVLQAGRGIAALMVVLFHINGAIFGKAKYWPDQIHGIFSFGNAGVEFFFVLSGFIIAHVHWRDIGARGRVRNFLWKRFARIYPPYWFALSAIVPVFFFVPTFGNGTETDLVHLSLSFLLLPTASHPPLDVAWTLQHEVLFYAVFAILLVNLRAGIALALLWGGACLAALDLAIVFPASFFFDAINLLFFLGVAAAWIAKTSQIRGGLWLLIGGAALFFGTGLLKVYGAVRFPENTYVVLYGLGSMAAIIGAIGIERRGFRTPATLQTLGDASYSIYLIHFPVLSVLAKLIFAAHLAHALPRFGWFVLLAIAATVSGLVFYQLVELPVLRFLQRLSGMSDSAST